MDRELFKKKFKQELIIFHIYAKQELAKGYTITQIEDNLIRLAPIFYKARELFDPYALRKCYFIYTYVYQIIKGSVLDEYLNDFCDELERENKIR